MNNICIVLDIKKIFYYFYICFINLIYNWVIEELLVEMYLIFVNVDYSYNLFYVLGVVIVFDCFM